MEHDGTEKKIRIGSKCEGLEEAEKSSVSTDFASLLCLQCQSQHWWISPVEFLLHAVVCLAVVAAACSLVASSHQRKAAALKLIAMAADPILDDRIGGSRDPNCRLHLAESLPQNLSFPSPSASGSMSTLDAWLELIDSAKESLLIAAYKSSLRGVHVFGPMAQSYSAPGEEVYEAIVRAGLERGVRIRMVENGPSKDRGDNEDGRILARQRVLTHRVLNFARLSHTGVMHSKFLVADSRHFYLGSANLDWRSLNQKLETGVYATNCPSLAADLASIFEGYWLAAGAAGNKSALADSLRVAGAAGINSARPILLSGPGKGLVHFASSPPFMNPAGREWDLDALLRVIGEAKSHLYLHVMDYFPLYLYGGGRKEGGRYWPKIDNSLREAVLRGVYIRILTSAIHYPHLGIPFLRSLQSLSAPGNGSTFTKSPQPSHPRQPGPAFGSIAIRILKVPTPSSLPRLVRRDRRTHKKFVVSDHSALVGTSNLAADYFEDRGTGVAIVIRQEESGDGSGLDNATLVEQIRASFLRDWDSGYAHPLDEYYEKCIATAGNGVRADDICEEEKDLSLLATGRQVSPPSS